MTGAEISIQLELEFGDRYTGEASLQPNHRWIPHGRGVLSSPHGHSYDGQFVNRMREGEGTLSVAGLFTMRSKWRANRPDLSSPVAVEYADGSTYRGYVQLRPALPAEVAAARPCGANMSTFSRWVRSIRLARTRTGEWRNRLRGSRYLGDWMNDLPCGFGTFIDGGWTSRYTGELRSGLFHGIGTLCAFEWSSEGWRAPTGPCGVSCMGDGVHICGGVSPCVVNGRWREGAVDGECATTLPLGESLYVESSRVHGVATRQEMDDCSGAREWRMWDALFHRKGDAEHLRLVHQYAEKLASTHYTSNAEWVGVLSQFLSTSAVFDFAHRVFTVHFLFCHDHRPLPRDFTEEANVLLRQTSRMWVALGDIVAFTQSTLRWLTSIFGNATADNLAECAHQISMFIADRVFPRLHPLLLRLYREAFWSEEAHLASATSLELDNCMSKTESSATCFPDLAATEVLHLFSSAMSILDELHTEPKTLTALFQTVLRWSVEVERVSRQHLSTSCLSMDELLPIQEFLLHRCQTPHLYAHAKLLVDLASKDFLVSAASPECYSSTTVFACLSSIIEFHSSHNSNGSQSGAPHSDDVTALNKALASMIEDAQNCALCANDSLISSTPSASALVKGYVKSWIPCILRCFSPEACGSVSGECAHDISSFGCLPDNDCIVAVAELVAMKSNSLRVLCWAFADKVLQRVGVRLRLTWMNDGESPALATDVFSSIVGDASNSFQNVCGENPHCRLSIIHFSHSHYDSVAMKDLANVLDFSL